MAAMESKACIASGRFGDFVRDWVRVRSLGVMELLGLDFMAERSGFASRFIFLLCFFLRLLRVLTMNFFKGFCRGFYFYERFYHFSHLAHKTLVVYCVLRLSFLK